MAAPITEQNEGQTKKNSSSRSDCDCLHPVWPKLSLWNESGLNDLNCWSVASLVQLGAFVGSHHQVIETFLVLQFPRRSNEVQLGTRDTAKPLAHDPALTAALNLGELTTQSAQFRLRNLHLRICGKWEYPRSDCS